MLTRMWNNRDSHSFLVRKKNNAVTLEGNLAVSYQLNPDFLYNPEFILQDIRPCVL